MNAIPTSPTPGSRTAAITAVAAVVGFAGLAWWAWPQAPRGDRAAVERAREHLDRGQPDQAVRALAEVQGPSPEAAEAMTRAGRAFLMTGRLSPARRALERSLELWPDQADALKMLAAVHLTFSDAPKALALLDRAARLDPGDFRPWYAMGKAHAGQGEIDEAARAYGEALRRRPPPAEALEIRLGLVRALLDLSRAEDAGPILDDLRRDATDDPRTLGLAARRARDIGEGDAVFLADSALAIDPANLDALLTRAREALRTGQPDAALADLERATAVAPDDLAALELRLQAESRLGRDDRAAATADRAKQARERREAMGRLASAISRRPDDPGPRWQMGRLAAEAGQVTLASQCYQAALDLDPGCRPAREGLAALRARPRAGP